MIAPDIEHAIAFSDAGKKFGDTWVLEDLDFVLPQATILGLIGPSGSGKTTTVRLATGFYRPDAGDVTVLGTLSSELGGRQRTEIGYLPQDPVLFDNLSLRGNLNFHASLNGVRFTRKQRLDELLELVDLSDDDRKLVGQASGGMQRRLALAGAMVHDPAILMLDEPTAGVDPILRRRFWDHFRSLRDGGTTMVISTQFVSEASNCDVVAMIAHGRIAAIGRPEELLERARGGRLVDLEFEHEIPAEFVGAVRSHDEVVELVYDGSRMMAVTTRADGASAAEICAAVDPDRPPVVVAERPPDWDEVFINLVGEDSSDDVDVDSGGSEPR